MLIIMAGMPGTGKSTIARALAAKIGAHVYDKDAVREAMFGALTAFTTEQDDVVVDAMLRAAEYLWKSDPELKVIIDGRVFSRNEQLRQVKAFAERCGQGWRVVECICSAETARARIAADVASGKHVAGNRTPGLYDEVRKRFQPIPQPKIEVDTEVPLERSVEVLLARVSQPSV